MPAKPKDVITVRHSAAITREHRAALNGHRSFVVWFTGLSGSGKSTIAHTVEERLHYLGHNSFVLDGDNVRSGLCSDLGFSPEDRTENIRRIGEVAKLLIEAGVIVLIALISPFRAHRQQIRDLVGDQDFIEIFCRCPISVCEQRDVKGLYRRARKGEIKEYTGISSPYEEPLQPELTLETAVCSLEDCVAQVMGFMDQKGLLLGSSGGQQCSKYVSRQR